MLKELKKRIAEEQTAKENMSIEEMRHEQQLEQAYNEEQYAAARRRMLSIPFVDEDDYIPLGDIIARYSTSKAITPDLPIEEPDNSLNMGDEHLSTSVENLVPIPSEFEGIFDDTSDVPNCDNNRINVESDLVESLINRDTLIVHSSKINPILEEFADELAHIAPISPEIVKADFDPNDDTSSDDDDFEDIEYVILDEKLLNVHRLISNIESLKVNPTPDRVLESPSLFPIPVADSDSFLEESDTFLSHLDNSLPEFETFSNHTEETRSGSTTTHANYSLPDFSSLNHFISILPRPPSEPPDVCLDMLYNDESFEPGEGENIVVSSVEEDDSFTFTICTFLPFLTYPEVSPLSCSTGSEDLIFDPGIITFHFLKPLAFLWKCLSSIFALSKDE
ncbi:hypothetical protein Tco_0198755 [Tanacetum coccineum]